MAAGGDVLCVTRSTTVIFKILFILLLVLTFILTRLIYTEYIPKNNATPKKVLETSTGKKPSPKRQFTDSVNYKYIKPKSFVQSLTTMAQSLHKASIHAKSLKTISALKVATFEIRNILQQLKINYENITKRNVAVPRSVCQEEYLGSTYGNPLYEKGFEKVPCKHERPLSELISVILIAKYQSGNIKEKLSSLSSAIPGTQVIVGMETNDSTILTPKYIVRVNYTPGSTEGYIWNSLIEKVRTEYVLVARDIESFDKHMRIDRLIRVLETLGFAVAGGATRDVRDGTWTIGCYQSGLRNYSIVYQEGYDESVNECVVCDYVAGPFVTTSKLVRDVLFDNTIQGEGLFHDLFLNIGTENSVVCPDSMFQIKRKAIKSTPASWENFADKWELYKIKFIPGPEILMDCKRLTKKFCSFRENRLLPPCCLLDITVMTRHVMKVFKSRDIEHELSSGTLLGAVKLGSILPWDIDADIPFLLSNFSVVKSNLNEFLLPDHIFQIRPPLRHDYNGTLLSACFSMKSDISEWKMDICGKQVFNSYMSFHRNSDALPLQEGRPIKTKVKLNGVWEYGAFNPGLWLRNRYGLEIYKHAQHWRHLGKVTSVEQYPTRAFLKCPSPGHHACLDNYRTDGNLQFTDPVP